MVWGERGGIIGTCVDENDGNNEVSFEQRRVEGSKPKTVGFADILFPPP